MIFNIRATRVEISFWFVAVLTLLLVLAPQSNGAWCFVMCILHELGHLTAMFICGKRPEKIELGYFGMKIVTGARIVSKLSDIMIALAGPAINMIIAGIMYCFKKEDIAVISLALAIFNLLPVTVLDGGRVLAVLIDNPAMLKKIGLICAVAMTFVGAAVAVYSRTNFVLLIVSLYLLIGVITEK